MLGNVLFFIGFSAFIVSVVFLIYLFTQSEGNKQQDIPVETVKRVKDEYIEKSIFDTPFKKKFVWDSILKKWVMKK